MAETRKAFVFLSVEKVGIIEKPLPEPGPRDAVIRTTASFICTSDVHTVKGVIPL
jgi:threonine dehydrogenase-like Zn-dependent dehydrogenase